MLKMFLLVLLFIFISSCGREKVTESAGENIKTNTEETKAGNTKPEGTSGKDEQQETKEETKKGVIEELSYDVSSIGKDIKYEGTIVAGAKWKDDNGQNVVIITETKAVRYSSHQQYLEFQKKELYGYQYVTSGSETRLLWKINDFIKDCPLDMKLSLLPGSLTITDINKNGIGESTFLYSMTCRGDVGPDDMKLIMHEGDTKYAIRGTQKVRIEGKPYGGETNVDKSFNGAPAGFLSYAKGQWSKFIDQVMKYN